MMLLKNYKRKKIKMTDQRGNNLQQNDRPRGNFIIKLIHIEKKYIQTLINKIQTTHKRESIAGKHTWQNIHIC